MSSPSTSLRTSSVETSLDIKSVVHEEIVRDSSTPLGMTEMLYRLLCGEGFSRMANLINIAEGVGFEPTVLQSASDVTILPMKMDILKHH
jgi:hypothetical protein